MTSQQSGTLIWLVGPFEDGDVVKVRVQEAIGPVSSRLADVELGWPIFKYRDSGGSVAVNPAQVRLLEELQ